MCEQAEQDDDSEMPLLDEIYDEIERENLDLADAVFGESSHFSKNAGDVWPIAIVVDGGIAFVGQEPKMLNKDFVRLQYLKDYSNPFTENDFDFVIELAPRRGVDIAVSKIIAVYDCES